MPRDTISVQAKDEVNASIEGNFTVTLLDVYEDTDGDGFRDSLEASTGSDLIDPDSTPFNHGLVAWYPFDGNASDMSGNGNHGTVNGATLGYDRHGEVGKAYSFDRVDDYIDMGDETEFDGRNTHVSLSGFQLVRKVLGVETMRPILSKWYSSDYDITNAEMLILYMLMRHLLGLYHHQTLATHPQGLPIII